jgi:two-component system, chemotaxis family, protein-glutamate methylesterase/glutaminase
VIATPPLTHQTRPADLEPALLRVLVVDDSLIYRKVVRDTLATIPGVEVVASAANGLIAIDKIQQLKPDLVTLDFEMPELDGPGVLAWMKKNRVATRAVMISALTSDGATSTLQALEAGAFDFVVKPSGSDTNRNREDLQTALTEKVDALRAQMHSRAGRVPLRSLAAGDPPGLSSTRTPLPGKRSVVKPGDRRIGIVGIGVSTGGPDALRIMLPKLPADLPVPIVLVQHMPPVFTRSLATSLDKLCALRVYEAEHGQVVRRGEVAIAPGGRQMRVVPTATGDARIELTDDLPVQSCKPSVDYLFNSLAESYEHRTLAVIMTGMGYDGADACARLGKLGAPVICQNEASCVVFGMPRRPVEEGVADAVVPLDRIADTIHSYCVPTR